MTGAGTAARARPARAPTWTVTPPTLPRWSRRWTCATRSTWAIRPAGAGPQYDGIKAFSETDFTEDLKAIAVPVLVMHGDDDQIVPYADSAPLSVKLLRNGTLKTYPGFDHGMCTTHPDEINADLLAFFRA